MTDAWSRYWARETSGACLPGAPPAVQSVLIGSWSAFGRLLPPAAQVLDVASGGGAVLKILREAADSPDLVGIDSARVLPAATALGVRGGIDAARLPFADASFHAVTSQFGLEYCPQPAWAEAVRVLKPGGQLQMICHHRDSAAVRHNGARLAAMRAMAEAGLFGLAIMVARGQAEDPVIGARVVAARNAHASQSVVAELPMALGQWAQARRPDAVAAIISEAEAEMERLAAMQAAALDEASMRARLAWLAGLPGRAEVLAGPDGPVGWLVQGRKA